MPCKPALITFGRMSPPLWEQLLPLALCVAGLVGVAWYSHVLNRNAGNGWRYVYWQPWRIWAMGIVGGLFALMLIGAGLLHHLG